MSCGVFFGYVGDKNAFFRDKGASLLVMSQPGSDGRYGTIPDLAGRGLTWESRCWYSGKWALNLVALFHGLIERLPWAEPCEGQSNSKLQTIQQTAIMAENELKLHPAAAMKWSRTRRTAQLRLKAGVHLLSLPPWVEQHQTRALMAACGGRRDCQQCSPLHPATARQINRLARGNLPGTVPTEQERKKKYSPRFIFLFIFFPSFCFYGRIQNNVTWKGCYYDTAEVCWKKGQIHRNYLWLRRYTLPGQFKYRNLGIS